MSDLGRKSVGDRKAHSILHRLGCLTNPLHAEAKEKVTPDSQKSTLDKATESVSSTVDKGIASVQPGTRFSPSAHSHMPNRLLIR
jgi:Heat shock protein 9/12